ncbi:hypothetical protein, partial [Achromobacter sp.]|uniref:hypothetical protein n=1 Tax=Achromobacter sp. TaxID=134375 RepID=UPI0028AFC022
SGSLEHAVDLWFRSRRAAMEAETPGRAGPLWQNPSKIIKQSSRSFYRFTVKKPDPAAIRILQGTACGSGGP